ncbi:putative aldouronate transport system permease protein [Paenibacillus sp. UNCCL117]|uniref:carbohydrate ABC transporter permease n=1 Tax=unclassified Paenibacillus TaxID=185978 RepID=UPI000881A6E7|nr:MULTISPECIES: carbohydrate ABC transporter permease [unclassified Paenibacillus]SDE68480.1 carbohydrate ABC transporter membrane protein 2, CUT1 family [Paenibacillus sp. cl123]SFW70851.1 putative aldouronate transport system permease protein [Paenibacillus sp. UNCCL117]
MLERSKGDLLFETIIHIVLGMILIVVLFPLIYVISASLSEPSAILLGEIRLLPKGFNVQAYKRVFDNADIMSGYLNTIFYTVVGTAINLVMTTLAAYPLSRKDFYGRQFVTGLVVFTMFFSGGMIPMYLLIRDLGMLNTIWALVLPGAISVWNLIIMRTFFQVSIPLEIQEAASIDGCSNSRILWRIVLPLSLPILAVMTLFYAVGHWNAFFSALIYLTDRGKYPLQLVLREILIQNQMNEMASIADDTLMNYMMQIEAIKYAVVVVANLPMLLLYPFLQKYFVKGVMIGALKG